LIKVKLENQNINMRRKITLQELVAEDATKEAKMLVVKYGETPARNMDDLINKLNYITSTHKESALSDLAKIHPDKDLILAYCSTEKKSNACGCGGCSDFSGFNGEETSGCCGSCSCGGKKSSADGSESKTVAPSPTPEKKSDLKEYLPIAIVGGMFLVGLHIIFKNT
jgi:hypothetical protein